MKRFVEAFAAASVASCLTAADSAVAQDQKGVWRHPSGAYELDYGAVRWKIGGSFEYGGRPALVTFEPPYSHLNSTGCLIFEAPVSQLPPEADQTRANGFVERYTAQNWPTALGYDPADVRHFANEMVDGVRVATMVVDTSNPEPLRSFYRSFVIVTPEGPRHQELSCSLTPGGPEAEAKRTAEFISSLRFIRPPVPD